MTVDSIVGFSLIDGEANYSYNENRDLEDARNMDIPLV